MSRADSTHVETQIYKDALTGIPVPACAKIAPEEMPYWIAITQARAEWNMIDLIHAVDFAKCLYARDVNQEKLKAEGDVLVNQNGTQIMNPRFAISEQLSRRAMMYSTKLHVHPVATLGEAKLGKAKNAKKKTALEVAGMLDDEESLLARPN